MNEVEALEQIENMLEIKENFAISDSVRKDTRYNLLREIEALKVSQNALEKQIKKKPTVDEFDYGNGYVCGECESFLHYVDDDDENIRTNYCCHCGTKIDWS